MQPGQKINHYPEFDEHSISDIVLVGDIINILPNGLRQWEGVEGKVTIQSIADLAKIAKLHYIFGNHEGRLKWLTELFSTFPDVNIYKEQTFEISGEKWHVEHGYKFNEWRVLHYFADDIIEFLTTHPLLCGSWYKFCKRVGWLPGQYERRTIKHQLRYENRIIAYWAWVMHEARKKNMNFIVGHSHSRVIIEPNFIKIIDLGVNEPLILP